MVISVFATQNYVNVSVSVIAKDTLSPPILSSWCRMSSPLGIVGSLRVGRSARLLLSRDKCTSTNQVVRLRFTFLLVVYYVDTLSNTTIILRRAL